MPDGRPSRLGVAGAPHPSRRVDPSRRRTSRTSSGRDRTRAPAGEAEPLAGQPLQRLLALVAPLQVLLDVRQLAPVELLFQELHESLVAWAEAHGGSVLVAESRPCSSPGRASIGPKRPATGIIRSSRRGSYKFCKFSGTALGRDLYRNPVILGTLRASIEAGPADLDAERRGDSPDRRSIDPGRGDDPGHAGGMAHGGMVGFPDLADAPGDLAAGPQGRRRPGSDSSGAIAR